MPIGVDLDEVVFPLMRHHAPFLSRKYNQDIREEKFTNYNFWEHYGVSREQAIDDFLEFCDTSEFLNAGPITGSQEGIRELKKIDELYIITSRQNCLQQRTYEWLDKHFNQVFSKIIMGNSFSKEGVKIPKRQLCEENDVWLLIEDHFDYAKDVAQDIPVIMPNRPWNRKSLEGVRNLIRAYNWSDISNTAGELATNPYCLAA